MQKPISSVFTCLTAARMRRLLFFSLMLFSTTLITGFEAKAAYINFNGYPADTPITDQYQSLGIIFSGGTQPPPIIQTFSDGTGALTTYYDGGFIVGSFVDPNDAGRPLEVSSFSIRFNMIWWSAIPTTVTYYDISGGLVRQDTYASWLEPPYPPDLPQKFHKFVVDSGNYTRIENLSFILYCPGTDADGDGHYTPESCKIPNDDCNDSDPSIPSQEICFDGIDNDCDGNADCHDIDCSPEPLCSPRTDCNGNVIE